MTVATEKTVQVIAWAVECSRGGTNYLEFSFQFKYNGDEEGYAYDHYLVEEQIALRDIIIDGFVTDPGDTYASTLCGWERVETTAYHPNTEKLRYLLKVMTRLDKAIEKARADGEGYSRAASVFAVLKAAKVVEVRYRKLGAGTADIKVVKIGDARDWLALLFADIEKRWFRPARNPAFRTGQAHDGEDVAA